MHEAATVTIAVDVAKKSQGEGVSSSRYWSSSRMKVITPTRKLRSGKTNSVNCVIQPTSTATTQAKSKGLQLAVAGAWEGETTCCLDVPEGWPSWTRSSTPMIPTRAQRTRA